MRLLKKNLYDLVLVLFFSLLAGWALLHPGLPPTHDGEYHVIRFYEFDKALRGGQLYPRWAADLNNGYGVPLFNYVYPLPNYVASFFHLFGISFIDSFKLNMFFALIIGSLGMFLWARYWFGLWGGVVACVFYAFAPYHLLDIYIRGSVGEVWALAFFPLVLWAGAVALNEKKALFLPVTAFLLALVIFSHNILAFLFFPFVLSYFLFLTLSQKDEKKAIFHTGIIVFLAIGLSAIFWLPALLERSYVQGLEVFDYKRHFVEIYQLLIPSWGSGFSGDVATEGLSTQIGLAHLTVFLVCFFMAIILLIRKKIQKTNMLFFMLFWTFVSIFFMLSFSAHLWDILPLMQYLQFPWRFLSLVILCLSFMSGSIVYYRKSTILICFLIASPVLLGIGYAKPAYYHMRDDYYYISRSNFIDGTNSPGNAFNTIWFNRTLPKFNTLVMEKENTIQVNIAYFPGWQIFVDGQKIETKPNKDGLVSAKSPQSGGVVGVKFLDTPTRKAATLVSLASFIILCFLLIGNLPARMKK